MNKLLQSMNSEIDFTQKKEKYVEIFNLHFPDKKITEKNYDVTIVRWLVMYFLYQEKKINKIKIANHETIATLFDLKTHSTVVKAIDKVESYLSNEKYLNRPDLEAYKDNFMLFYYRFQQIFLRYKCCA